jgi:long-chain fatty acid transport protein
MLGGVSGSWRRVAVILAVMLLALARASSAQVTAQVPLQFDFLTPGARSLAMGGAFIGAADDATAAFTNPAGLAWLKTKEVSAEGRFRRFETPFLSGGRISGSITGRGLDTIPGPVYDKDIDNEFGPAFLAVLIPVGKATVTAYRHELVGLENSFFPTGVFERFTFAGITDDNNRENPVGGTRRVRITNYGGTFGLSIGERVGLGGGLSAGHFTLDSSFARFGVESVFGPVLPNARSATAVQDGHGVAVSANAGVIIKVAERLKAGATVRRGPRFSFTQEDRVFDTGFHLIRSGHFKVPDVFGAGVEWRAAENLRVLVDYDWVHYSQIKKDFIDFQAISSNRQNQLLLESASEWHGGVEYQLLNMGKPLAVRAGLWYDPDHAPRYISTPQHDELDVLLGAALPGGSSLVHYTFGAGVVLMPWLELNGAADISSRTTYATTSVVVRF